MNDPVHNTDQAFYADHLKLSYETSRWERILFEARGGLEADTRLTNAVGELGDSVARTLGVIGEDGDCDDDDELCYCGDLADAFGSEVFSRLYNDPEKLAERSDEAPWSDAAHGILDEVPEFEALRQSVEGDPDFSALAAIDLVKAVAEKLPELIEEQKREEENDSDDDPDTESDTQTDESQESDTDTDTDNDGSDDSDDGPSVRDELRAILRDACTEAAEQTDEERAAMAGIAPGLESAPPTHEQPDPKRMELAERLRSDSRLRDVLRRAGRIARVASRKRSTRRAHGYEEVVDIERGADIARVLPSQLARLRHPRLRLLAMKDLVERQLVQYRLEGSEPLERGPIVVLLDESSSMTWGDLEGLDPNGWASAIAIACVGQAAKEHRAVEVIGFNYSPTTSYKLDERGRGTAWDISRGGKEKELDGVAGVVLALASRRCSGGTSFDSPILRALDGGLTRDRADLVFVTDGEASVSNATLERLQEAKERGLTVYGFLVGGGTISGAMRDICDELVNMKQAADLGNASGRALGGGRR